ncbi:MAG: sulfatase [bacterium]
MTGSAAPDRPNILLVVAEDMGPQLGAYGCADARTPHLDRFAEGGVRFDRAWCSYPVCSPGRSSLLTGLPPHENGTMGLATCGFATFDGVPSLPQLLKRQGNYRTGLIGKLHVLPEHRFRFDLRWADAQRFGFHGRDYGKMLRFADEFMNDELSPFFLMVALPDAHVPFLNQSFGEPAQPMTADDVGTPPGMDQKRPEWDHWYAAYHNCIQRVDGAFGGLMDILERRGLRDNTLVIFTSDHGLQFPRGKLSLYEPGLSIPLLLGGAGVARRAEGVGTPVSQEDVFATIVDAAGIDRPEPCRGESLLEIAAAEGDPDRLVFGEITACMPPTYFPQRAVRSQRYKLIRTFDPGREDPGYRLLMDRFSAPGEMVPPDPPNSSSRPPIPPLDRLSPAMRAAYDTWRKPPAHQLYDLWNDPLETVNLAGAPALAETEAQLRDALDQWMERTDDFLLDDDRRQRFEAEIAAYLRTQQAGAARDAYQWTYVETARPRTLAHPTHC